jgi:hypothetical protein
MPRRPPAPPPSCFVPSCPADFVGQAGHVAEMLLRKAEGLREHPDRPLKLLISGAPGIGKTSLANLIARTLASHPAAIEDVNGREVGLDIAREWIRGLGQGSLFGPWSVKVVNELDRCSKDAQDLLLTYLDRMPAGHAILGTTNLDLASLTERFQTRFLPVRLQPPENEALAAFLARRWNVPIPTTRMIAAGATPMSGRRWRTWRCGWGEGEGKTHRPRSMPPPTPKLVQQPIGLRLSVQPIFGVVPLRCFPSPGLDVIFGSCFAVGAIAPNRNTSIVQCLASYINLLVAIQIQSNPVAPTPRIIQTYNTTTIRSVD